MTCFCASIGSFPIFRIYIMNIPLFSMLDGYFDAKSNYLFPASGIVLKKEEIIWNMICSNTAIVEMAPRALLGYRNKASNINVVIILLSGFILFGFIN